MECLAISERRMAGEPAQIPFGCRDQPVPLGRIALGGAVPDGQSLAPDLRVEPVADPERQGRGGDEESRRRHPAEGDLAVDQRLRLGEGHRPGDAFDKRLV
jgi:hypothetical protein